MMTSFPRTGIGRDYLSLSKDSLRRVLLKLANVDFLTHASDMDGLLKLVALNLAHQLVVIVLASETRWTVEEDFIRAFLGTAQEIITSPTQWLPKYNGLTKTNANTFGDGFFELIPNADVVLEGHRVLRVLGRQHILTLWVGLDELSVMSSFMRWSGLWCDLGLVQVRALPVPNGLRSLHGSTPRILKGCGRANNPIG